MAAGRLGKKTRIQRVVLLFSPSCILPPGLGEPGSGHEYRQCSRSPLFQVRTGKGIWGKLTAGSPPVPKMVREGNLPPQSQKLWFQENKTKPSLNTSHPLCSHHLSLDMGRDTEISGWRTEKGNPREVESKGETAEQEELRRVVP